MTMYLHFKPAFLLNMTRSRLHLAAFLVAWAALLVAALSPIDASASASAPPTCFGRPATIVGSGLSVVWGTRGVDVMVLSRGAEAEAQGGDDFICGTARAFGGAGDDHILYAGPPRAIDLWGEKGNDRIILDSPGSGGDVVGGPGNDFISDRDGGHRLTGDAGRDVLVGGAGNDGLFGGPGRDVLRGNDGFDHLFGGTASDRLFGGAGPDVLNGGDGSDIGRGGPGGDTCTEIEKAFNC